MIDIRYYKMVVAYDGTDYYGWQPQKDAKTVAGVLADTFKKVFGRPVTLMGASRTDAGVHALGQVVSFATDLAIECTALLRAWNVRLPTDIKIRSIEVVDRSFYSMRNVIGKEYWYHVFTRQPLPGYSRYGWWNYTEIDFVKLERCLQQFIGTHDFRAFCSADIELTNTVRTITTITVRHFAQMRAFRVIIRGPGFLRYMIRRIVGACVYVASRPHVPIEILQEVLAAKNPAHKLPSAPAQGLLLRKIMYKKL